MANDKKKVKEEARIIVRETLSWLLLTGLRYLWWRQSLRNTLDDSPNIIFEIWLQIRVRSM
jgi:hypothetical protein